VRNTTEGLQALTPPPPLWSPAIPGREKESIPTSIYCLGQNFGTGIDVNSVLVVNPLGSTKLANGRYHTSQNNFAIAVGGGLDIRLTKCLLCGPFRLTTI
jgi:hypothetical protein